jgi:hypothetical protein
MINFQKYDEDNTEIWKMFVHLSKQTRAKGFNHYSAKGIFELIRWHTSVKGNDYFKINNNYHADYARKMMRVHKEFEGFFRVRELKAIRK